MALGSHIGECNLFPRYFWVLKNSRKVPLKIVQFCENLFGIIFIAALQRSALSYPSVLSVKRTEISTRSYEVLQLRDDGVCGIVQVVS